MEEFAVDTTLEIKRKTRLDDEVSSGAPWMEVQTDETWMLREREPMTSNVGSHGHIKRCRGVQYHRLCVVSRKVRYRSLAKISTPHHKLPWWSGRMG
jgi:hypothetical protein